VSKANAYGIAVQMVISGIASKREGIPKRLDGSVCGSGQPSGLNPSPQYFHDFVYRELPYIWDMGVRRISLWNEPNLKFFLSLTGQVNEDQTQAENNANRAQGKRYYQLWKKGLQAVRELQKAKRIGAMQVLFGELSSPNNGVGFMKEVFRNGKIQTDGLAIHPYQFCTPPDSKARPPKTPMPPAPANFNTREVAEHPNSKWVCRRAMKGGMGWIGDWKKQIAQWKKEKKLTTFQGKAVPLYLTEWALLRGPYVSSVAERYRVNWYPRAMNFALKHKVKQMLIFQINRDTNPAVWDSGILDTDGLTPLPAYTALQKWARSKGYIR